MKKLLLLLIIPFLSFGQDIPKFKLQPGLLDKIVITVDSLSTEALYNKTINWVKESYASPDNVLKSEIKNEKIRIRGYEKNVFRYKLLGMVYMYDVDYSIEFEFKESRLRMSYYTNQIFNSKELSKWELGSTHDVFWDEKHRKRKNVKKNFDQAIIDYEKHMNRIESGLYNYLKKPIQEDNW